MDEHQLFLNIECKLLDKYGCGTHMVVKQEAYRQPPKCRCCLAYYLQDEDRRLFPYPPEIHMPCKDLPNLGTQIMFEKLN